MSCRKPCKECPWREENSNRHNLNFRTYVDKMKSIGKNDHAWHLINRDIWGGKSEINSNNVCIGSLMRNKSLNK